MKNFDEADLRTLLQGEANRLNVPRPPLGQLLDRGRAAARARRIRIGIGMAAAVVSIAAGGAVLAQPGLLRSEEPVVPVSPTRTQTPTPSPVPQRPETVEKLPQGDLPALPFVVGETMYYGRVATSHEQGPVGLRYGGAGVVVMRTESSGAIHALDSNGEDMRMVSEESSAAPVVSVAGDLVAWRTARADGKDVVVWDLSAGEEIASLSAPETEGGEPWELVGIDNRNNVFAVSSSSAWMWTPSDSTPRRLVGDLSGNLVEVATEGLLFRDDRPDDGVPVYVVAGLAKNNENDGSNVVYEQERLRARHASLSLDGTQIALVDPGGDLWVSSRSGDGDREMLVPDDIEITALFWETDQSLLVTTPDGPGGANAAVRCNADSGSCELAAAAEGPYEMAER